MINKNKKKNFIVLFLKKPLTSSLGSDIFNIPSKLGKEEIMKKEEILEKSRKENKKKDLQEIEVELKASQYASIGMLLLAFIFFTCEIVTGKGTNPAFYSLITLFNAIMFGYRGIKIEKNRSINVLTSVIWGLLTIILVLSYFKVI